MDEQTNARLQRLAKNKLKSKEDALQRENFKLKQKLATEVKKLPLIDISVKSGEITTSLVNEIYTEAIAYFPRFAIVSLVLALCAAKIGGIIESSLSTEYVGNDDKEPSK